MIRPAEYRPSTPEHSWHSIQRCRDSLSSQPDFLRGSLGLEWITGRPELCRIFAVRVRSSRPGEFHPEALTEPYVTLSGQTALHSDSLSFLRTDPLEEKAPPGFPVGPQFPSALCHPLRSTPITGASSLLQDDPPSASASIFPLRGSHL